MSKKCQLLVSKYNLFLKNNIIIYLKLTRIAILKLIEFYYFISIVNLVKNNYLLDIFNSLDNVHLLINKIKSTSNCKY
jgi:hypothetical protein